MVEDRSDFANSRSDTGYTKLGSLGIGKGRTMVMVAAVIQGYLSYLVGIMQLDWLIVCWLLAFMCFLLLFISRE